MNEFLLKMLPQFLKIDARCECVIKCNDYCNSQLHTTINCFFSLARLVKIFFFTLIVCRDQANLQWFIFLPHLLLSDYQNPAKYWLFFLRTLITRNKSLRIVRVFVESQKKRSQIWFSFFFLRHISIFVQQYQDEHCATNICFAYFFPPIMRNWYQNIVTV